MFEEKAWYGNPKRFWISTSDQENDSLWNVPPGCTSCVLVADTVNKLFKDQVRYLFVEHFDKHLQLHVEAKLSSSQQRILMAKWVC